MQCLEGIVGNFDRDGGHRHSWFNRIRSACGSRSHVAGLPSQHCNHTWLPPTQSTCATCQTGSATHGLFAERIFIAGGRGRPSVQPHGDVLKQPVHLTRESESCALGSAMTAAVAAGAYRDCDEAAPGPWSPSRKPSSPTWLTPASTTSYSETMSSSTGGSMPADPSEYRQPS